MMDERSQTFTVAEANRRLPLVRSIMEDIRSAYPELQERMRHVQRRARETDDAVELQALRDELEAEAERLREYIAELERLGCSFKGFDEGLVDFYAELGGRTICLCWKAGEPAIGFWHEVDAGFAGRQPLTPEIEAAIERGG
jgi:hypothetical protein